MATLREYFDTDFSSVLNTAHVITIILQGQRVDIVVREHFDFDANAKFFSCYLPTNIPWHIVRDNIEQLIAVGNDMEIQMGLPGERQRTSGDLQFAGRLFIYHELEIDTETEEGIRGSALQSHVFVQFRGPLFATERTNLEKPLAFISHDARDKNSVARPIAIGLSALMCPVWFDEFSLKVGDRLRESIEHGLMEARKCILILSPHFLSNSGWTKTEFNAIFTREMVSGSDVILPVWHGVTHEQVYEYSPVLADRYALNWSDGDEATIKGLRKAIGN